MLKSITVERLTSTTGRLACKDNSLIHRWLLLFIIAINIFLIALSPIHVDEGWYHNLAYSQAVNGFPSFNAMADIPIFQGYYGGGGIMVRLLGMFIGLVHNHIGAIIMLRIIMAVLFYLVLMRFVKKSFSSSIERSLVFAGIIYNPIVLRCLSIVRPEIPFTTIALVVLTVLLYERNSSTKQISIVLLFYLQSQFHANAIISYVFLASYYLFERNKLSTKIQMIPILTAVLIFHNFSRLSNLFGLSANSIRSAQFQAMYFSGDTQKIMLSLKSLPEYLIRELSRYWQFTSSSWKSGSIRFLLTTCPVIVILIQYFKKRSQNTLLLWTISCVLIFIILGNKTELYLVYLVPSTYLIIYRAIFAFKKGARVTILIIVTMLLGFNALMFLSRSITNHRNRAIIREYVDKSEFDVLYAPLEFSPEFCKLKFYCTTQKNTNNLTDNIRVFSQRCLIIKERDSEFDIIGKRAELFKTDTERYNVGLYLYE